MSAWTECDAPAVSAAGAAPGPERGDAGRALFGHAARLLAEAKALEATASASGTAPALGPTLACMEASLAALAHAAHRLGEEALESTPSSSHDRKARPLRRETPRRFDRLCATLEDARAACAAACTTGEHGVPPFHWPGL